MRVDTDPPQPSAAGASPAFSACKAVIAAATIAAVVVVLQNIPSVSNLVSDDWRAIEGSVRGGLGPLWFVVLGGLLTVFGLPRILLSAAAGLFYGVPGGIVAALAATEIGCITSYYYARILGREFVHRRFGHRLKWIENAFSSQLFWSAALLRNVPLSSNTAVNFAAGVLLPRPLPYFAGSALGYLPQTLVFVLIGSGVQEASSYKILGGALLLAALIALFVTFARGPFVGYREAHQTRSAHGAD